MFLDFFYLLRREGFPVSLHEYLTLLGALQANVIDRKVDDFYALSRAVLVKQEALLDRFDLLFSQYFEGIHLLSDAFFTAAVPREWWEQEFWRHLSEEEKNRLEKLGGLDALLDRFRDLLNEQRDQHAGGNKWIGTGGTSPFGQGGYHPEGLRIGGKGGNRNALKVWQRRDFQNLDDRVELNTRNIKMILKRLRFLTRTGVADELDLDETIRRTSENAGMLDIALQASKKNRVKVLMLMDVGGSMDDHVELCEQLFSAARWEFKHLEFFYFHNCLYESVWRDNRRRWGERIPTLDLLHKYNGDYKVIFVGDAAMSPYEIYYRGGSVEHMNEEPGMVWLERLRSHFKNMIWINPLPEYEWEFFESVSILRQFTRNQMFPMTMDGLTHAMKSLRRANQPYDNSVWEE